MDHKELHHEHHRKERAERKASEKRHDAELARRPQTLHPVWFLVLGTIGVTLAMLIYTLVF